jgi:hypothetical protein
MDDFSLKIILGLVGFLQVLFIFLLGRIFFIQDKLFSVSGINKKDCEKKILKNYDEARGDREKMKIEYTLLLEKHYVTTGQLNTLEEKLIGQMEKLSMTIEHLTDATNRLKDNK